MPRHVIKGAYLTWYDPIRRQWWHRGWFSGKVPANVEVPTPAIVKGNIRATIDRHFAPIRAKAKDGASAPERRPQSREPAPAFANRASDIRRALGLGPSPG